MNPLPARRQTLNSIPITVLCGFPGAGKTTPRNHLLTQTGGQRIAVVVNEFGAVNVDASCTLRGDLLRAVDRLLQERELDAILIESTGIGEPAPFPT